MNYTANKDNVDQHIEDLLQRKKDLEEIRKIDANGSSNASALIQETDNVIRNLEAFKATHKDVDEFNAIIDQIQTTSQSQIEDHQRLVNRALEIARKYDGLNDFVKQLEDKQNALNEFQTTVNVINRINKDLS